MFYFQNNENIQRAELNANLKLAPGSRIAVNSPNDVLFLESTCSHSHLPIDFLKQLGKAVEKVGPGITETAIIAALKGVGGAFENE
jgi:hypothetical protein